MPKSPAFTAQAERRTHPLPAAPRRRQLALELQAPVKLGAALLLAAVAIAAALPAGGTAALLVLTAAAVWRSLLIIGADAAGRTQARPQEEAVWDGLLALGAAVAALLLAVEGSLAGVLVAVAAALTFAALRLGTRYVVG